MTTRALVWLMAWASVTLVAKLTVVLTPPIVKVRTSGPPATVTKGAWPLTVVRDVLVAVPPVVAIAVPAFFYVRRRATR